MSYMLDENVWKDFKNTNLAEFAVGGPSVEILNKAYYDILFNDYLYTNYEVNKYGYPISDFFYKNPNEDSRIEFLYTKSNRSSYILSTVGNSKNSSADTQQDFMLAFENSNNIYDYYEILSTNYSNHSKYKDYGFRPMVCLKSDVRLIEEANGTFSISN